MIKGIFVVGLMTLLVSCGTSVEEEVSSVILSVEEPRRREGGLEVTVRIAPHVQGGEFTFFLVNTEDPRERFDSWKVKLGKEVSTVALPSLPVGQYAFTVVDATGKGMTVHFRAKSAPPRTAV